MKAQGFPDTSTADLKNLADYYFRGDDGIQFFHSFDEFFTDRPN